MPTRPVPRHLRAAHGLEEPRPPWTPDLSNTPNPPTWLSKEAKAEWRRIVKVCARYEGWLRQVDRAALTAYCVAWATFQEAAMDVSERGALVPARSSADENRAMVKNPSTQVMRDASASMRNWCRELGFTPDARGKINIGDVAGAQGESDLD